MGPRPTAPCWVTVECIDAHTHTRADPGAIPRRLTLARAAPRDSGRKGGPSRSDGRVNHITVRMFLTRAGHADK